MFYPHICQRFVLKLLEINNTIRKKIYIQIPANILILTMIQYFTCLKANLQKWIEFFLALNYLSKYCSLNRASMWKNRPTTLLPVSKMKRMWWVRAQTNLGSIPPTGSPSPCSPSCRPSTTRSTTFGRNVLRYELRLESKPGWCN